MRKPGFLELPFVGRKRELKILIDKFNEVLEYQGSCLFITGEPGIGKSRLIREFLFKNSQSATCINVRIRPDISYPRDLFVEIIRFYLTKTSHIPRAIIRVIDEKIYDEFAPSVPELRNYYPYEPRSSKRNGIEINEFFYRFMFNLSNFAPVILILEDIHESTAHLLNMLKYFLQNLESLPILCIMTSRRNSKIIQWFNNMRLKFIERINLSELNEEEIGELNNLLFDNDLNESFLKWLSQRTKGVPLFLREFLYTLIEKGILFFDSKIKKWRTIEAYPQIPAPDTITEMIKARIRIFSDKEIQFLKFVSAAGEEFNLAMPTIIPQKGVLLVLLRSGLIAKTENGYKFTHPLIRDVVYHSMGDNERKRLHYLLAEYFRKRGDEKGIVHQLLMAKVKDIKLVNRLIKIAENFRKNGNIPRAVFYTETALRVAKSLKKIPDKTTADIMYNYSNDLLRIGRYQEVIKTSQSLINRVKKNPKTISKIKLAKVYAHLSSAFLRAGQYNDVIEAADQGRRLFANTKSPEVKDSLIELDTNKVFAYKYQWLVDEALNLAINLKNRLSRTSNPYHHFRIYNLLGSIYNAMGNYGQAIQFRKDALDAALRFKNAPLIASARGNLGISLINAGKFTKGEECLLQHQDYSIKAGRIREEIMSYLNLGCCYLYQGYLQKAEDEYLKGIKISQQSGIKTELVWFYRFYGALLILDNRYALASENLQKGIELAKELKIRQSLFDLFIHKGLLGYCLNDKYRVNKLMIEVKNKFAKELKTKGEYLILAGFHSLLMGKNEAGFEEIDDGLDMMTQKEEWVDLCRYLWFCAQQSSKYKFGKSRAKEYLKKANDIAVRFNMHGWLRIFQPEKRGIEIEPMRIYGLGRLLIEVPTRGCIFTNEWEWQKPRQLFSIFITAILRTEQLNREKIGILLWPDLPRKKVTNNFHVCLSQLKKVIGKEYIVYKNGIYTLNNFWIDAVEFKELSRDAEAMLSSGKIHPAEIKLKEAIELYRGNFLEDLYDPWIDEIRDEFLSLYRRALLMLGEIYLRKVNFNEGVKIGKNILNLDPFDEEGHRFLIRCYAISGEKANAIKQYKRCLELFKAELNCLPSEKTQRLYQQIKGQ